MVADDNIVHLRNRLRSGATKIQFTHTIDGPVIETTLTENLLLKRFLIFALDDVNFQLSMLAKEKSTKKQKDENTLAGGFITAYLNILLEEINRAIQSLTPGEHKSNEEENS